MYNNKNIIILMIIKSISKKTKNRFYNINLKIESFDNNNILIKFLFSQKSKKSKI